MQLFRLGFADFRAAAGEAVASRASRGAMNGPMLFPDLDDARKQHAALLEIIIHNGGGWADTGSLRRVMELCRAAVSAIDDAECRENVKIIAQCAAELFSEQAHRKWDRGSLSGADFLRLEIMRALHSFSRRLADIEAARRGGSEPSGSSANGAAP